MNFFKNKDFLFTLVLLNLLGVVLALLTYFKTVEYYLSLNKAYIIPFFIVSLWLYVFALLLSWLVYKDKKIPEILGILAFSYMFVYGIGSVIFYPLFIIFVNGFSLYHFWNIFAHAYVAFQALIFLKYIKIKRVYSFFSIILFFLVKDYLDIFDQGFLYFVYFTFPVFLKYFLIAIILVLQILAFYILFRHKAQKT